MAEGEKYYFGPAWDFDVAFNFAKLSGDGYVISNPADELWTIRLMDEIIFSADVYDLFRARLREYITDIYPRMVEFIEAYSAMIEPSAKLNGRRWSAEGPWYGWAYLRTSTDTRTHRAELLDWLAARLDFLKSKYKVD